MRTLPNHDARGNTGIRRRPDDGDPEAAVAEDFGGPIAVDTDEIRHHVAGAALAAVDEQRDLFARRFGRRRLRDDDVLREGVRPDLGQVGEGQSVLRQPELRSVPSPPSARGDTFRHRHVHQ